MVLTTAQLAITFAIALTVFSIIKYVYRAAFHPLARFPGPWQAGLTKLFAFRLELGESSVVKHLPEWHRKYGSIVRVQPNELHIHDMTAYNTVFRANTKFDKDPAFYNTPAFDGSVFNILSAREAKFRRDLYQSHFSKANVNRLEPLIHEKLELFLSKLQYLGAKGHTVNASHAFTSLTADTVTHWAYQESIGALEVEGFAHPLLDASEQMSPVIPATWYFSGVFRGLHEVIRRLPKAWVPEAVGIMEEVREMAAKKVQYLLQQPAQSKDVLNTVFATALHPNTAKGQQQLSNFELTGDAVTMFLAGSDTTASTLMRGTWEILRNPQVLKRLQAELDEAMPEGEYVNRLYRQMELERLPYLRAIVKESLRMAMGASCRIMRVPPAEGAELCGQYIPPGTRLSFSAYVYNYDPKIFPKPHTFNPERWLDPDTNVSELENHMISFSKGGRGCIGINVAYCELYNTFAHVFRRFDLEIDGTTEEDMQWKDCFVPVFKGPLMVRVGRRG